MLPTLRNELVRMKARAGLLRVGDIDTQSRLWVSRKQTVEGEITKIEYRTEPSKETVWQIGANNKHNLATIDELQEVSRVSADVDIRIDDLPPDLPVQFDNDLLTNTFGLINSSTYGTDIVRVHNLTEIGGNRGGTVFQQQIYPPFATVMIAAASNIGGNSFTYVADQEATSSSYVVHDGLYYTVSGKPDSGLLMPASLDLAARATR